MNAVKYNTIQRIPALVLALVTVLAGPAFPAGQVVGDSQKSGVIDTVLDAFSRHYVYPGVAEEMETHVRRQVQDGVYRPIRTMDELTRQLRRDLRDVSDDRHIWIEALSPGELEPAIGEKTPQELIDRRARVNFGFTRAEILQGNVGYLKLDRFDDVSWAGETAAAAMNLLANCDALIIDLRENHGGYDSMVRFLSGYFFDGSRLLGSLYFTQTDSLEQAWSYAYVPGKKLVDVDLYLLTSGDTASGAEAFSYGLKHQGRATVVGEPTRGAAHWSEDFDFPGIGVRACIPIARPVNPVTGTSWEGTGVLPHVPVPSDEALKAALDAARNKSESR